MKFHYKFGLVFLCKIQINLMVKNMSCLKKTSIKIIVNLQKNDDPSEERVSNSSKEIQVLRGKWLMMVGAYFSNPSLEIRETRAQSWCNFTPVA